MSRKLKKSVVFKCKKAFFGWTLVENPGKAEISARVYNIETAFFPRCPINEDKSLMKIALKLFPEKIDNFTWREWTKAISDSSGVKGKKLFLSLRQALTGHASGPELANLLPIIGREKIVSRLRGEKS